MGKSISKIKNNVVKKTKRIGRKKKVFVLDEDMKQTFKEQKNSIMEDSYSQSRQYNYTASILSPKDRVFPFEILTNNDDNEKPTIRDTIKVNIQLYYDSFEIQNYRDNTCVYKKFDFRTIVEWCPRVMLALPGLEIMIDSEKKLPSPTFGIQYLSDNNISHTIEDDTDIETSYETGDNLTNIVLSSNKKHVETSKQNEPFTLRMLFMTHYRMAGFCCDLLQHIYQYMYDYGSITRETLEQRMEDVDAKRKSIFGL